MDKVKAKSEPGYTETRGFDAVVVSVEAEEGCFMVHNWRDANKRFFLEELSDCDRILVKVGAKLSYSEGVLVTADGHKSRVASIIFRRDEDGRTEQT